MSNIIYFDNNATTQVAPEVLEAMLPFFKDMYGNASSMHSFGGQVGKHIAVAREQIAELLGAMPDEILFTSCGTESDNTAVISAIETQPEKKHFITTRVEHAAMLAMGDYLEKKGYDVTYLLSTAKDSLIWLNLKPQSVPIPLWFPLCSPTMKPARFFPLPKLPK